MEKYRVPREKLKKLVEDRITDCKQSNGAILENAVPSIQYLVKKLEVPCYFSTIPEKYIDKAYNDTLLVLPALGIEEYEDSYFMNIDQYDSFLLEIRIRAIYQQLFDRQDIVFCYIGDKLSIIKSKTKVP